MTCFLIMHTCAVSVLYIIERHEQCLLYTSYRKATGNAMQSVWLEYLSPEKGLMLNATYTVRFIDILSLISGRSATGIIHIVGLGQAVSC